MRLQVFRLGLAALLFFGGLLWLAPGAQAQDQASLATTANNAMKLMSQDLSNALAASSETTAKADVRAGISAGEQAISALNTLTTIATNDVVRSRSKAALDQTTSAVNKAQAALGNTGDAFRSGVTSALADVNEAIGEFAPVLPLVGQATATATATATTTATPSELPQAGEGDLTNTTMVGLALIGLGMTAAGVILRRRLALGT